MRRKGRGNLEENLITEYTGTSIKLETQDLELMSEEELQEDSQHSQASKKEHQK